MTNIVALYCRLSPRPDGSYEGVEIQERWGRDYAARAWPGVPVEVYADKGISAANGDHRPEFDRLRADVRGGRVSRVWAVEQSRLERTETGWFTLAAELDAAGVGEVHTARDGVVRVRDEVAGIKAVLAAAEVRRLKVRVNDRLDANAGNGEPPGGWSFGYRRDRLDDGTKTLAVVPEQAAAVREAASRILSGWSLAAVARDLDARGFRGRNGARVTADSVRSFVTSPMVAGKRMHRGEVRGRGNWAPILDEPTWKAVRAKLAGNRRVTLSTGVGMPVSPRRRVNPNPRGRRYLLTGGLAVCGVCKAPLTGALKRLKGADEKIPYLSCHPKHGGRSCVGAALGPVEAHVLGELWTELDKPEFLDALAADGHAGRRDEILAGLDDVETQRGELARLWAAPGGLSTSEWQTARQTLDGTEDALNRELAAVPEGVDAATVAAARAAWPHMTLDEQREFLRLFVERVTLAPAGRGRRVETSDRVDVVWRVLA